MSTPKRPIAKSNIEFTPSGSPQSVRLDLTNGWGGSAAMPIAVSGLNLSVDLSGVDVDLTIQDQITIFGGVHLTGTQNYVSSTGLNVVATQGGYWPVHVTGTITHGSGIHINGTATTTAAAVDLQGPTESVIVQNINSTGSLYFYLSPSVASFFRVKPDVVLSLNIQVTGLRISGQFDDIGYQILTIKKV